ncbi:tripartite tricarboxylate transporter substrate binding protein [Agrobacterium vitis]|uniref:Tripartite tricarboxylate transporter substrate binding protein n=1 Tax=Agrobacterium vitis TaxID=373 RepID=A0AAE2UZE8_AGRVI|nr:tripartite tricarboxylate transporter substrate-binding protein [Agrobacterium vitis]MBF2718234.1 tripartite tricarboxylate transporter substrate binding protein [Agrobacterium vitis]
MIERRTLLKTLAGTGFAAAALAVVPPHLALAQTPRIKRLRIIAPAAAGSGYDETARVCERVMTESGLIGSAQITNIPGAGGTVGLMKFLEQYRGHDDALLVSGSTMVSAIIANKTPVEISAAAPIARLYGTANALIVPASSPYKTIGDLMSAFRKVPETISWAGGSIGGGDHLIAGMFAKTAGVDPKRLNYVAFAGGGEILAALLGGHVTMASSTWGEVAEQVRSGEVRCLGVTAGKDETGITAPTLRSQGVDLVFYTWRALLGAPGINVQQRENLLATVDAMIKSDPWKAEIERQGWIDFYLPGDAFASFVEEQSQIFRTTLRSLGLA